MTSPGVGALSVVRGLRLSVGVSSRARPGVRVFGVAAVAGRTRGSDPPGAVREGVLRRPGGPAHGGLVSVTGCRWRVTPNLDSLSGRRPAWPTPGVGLALDLRRGRRCRRRV